MTLQQRQLRDPRVAGGERAITMVQRHRLVLWVMTALACLVAAACGGPEPTPVTLDVPTPASTAVHGLTLAEAVDAVESAAVLEGSWVIEVGLPSGGSVTFDAVTDYRQWAGEHRWTDADGREHRLSMGQVAYVHVWTRSSNPES